MTSLCNEIASNRKNSFYKSENSVVWSDNNGKYLWLQNKGFTSLPEGLGKLNIYLDDDFLTQADKYKLKKWLPNCKINYQTRSEKKNAL